MQPRSQSFFAARNLCWSALNDQLRRSMTAQTNTAMTINMYFTARRTWLPLKTLACISTLAAHVTKWREVVAAERGLPRRLRESA